MQFQSLLLSSFKSCLRNDNIRRRLPSWRYFLSSLFLYVRKSLSNLLAHHLCDVNGLFIVALLSTCIDGLPYFFLLFIQFFFYSLFLYTILWKTICFTFKMIEILAFFIQLEIQLTQSLVFLVFKFHMIY